MRRWQRRCAKCPDNVPPRRGSEAVRSPVESASYRRMRGQTAGARPPGSLRPRHRHGVPWSAASPIEKADLPPAPSGASSWLEPCAGSSHARFSGEGRPAMAAPYPTCTERWSCDGLLSSMTSIPPANLPPRSLCRAVGSRVIGARTGPRSCPRYRSLRTSCGG